MAGDGRIDVKNLTAGQKPEGQALDLTWMLKPNDAAAAKALNMITAAVKRGLGEVGEVVSAPPANLTNAAVNIPTDAAFKGTKIV